MSSPNQPDRQPRGITPLILVRIISVVIYIHKYTFLACCLMFFFSSQYYFPDQSHGHSSTLANIRPPSPRRPGLNSSDLLNPILHPPRLTSSSVNKTEGGSGQQGEKKKRVGSEFGLITICHFESLLLCSHHLFTSYWRLFFLKLTNFFSYLSG